MVVVAMVVVVVSSLTGATRTHVLSLLPARNSGGVLPGMIAAPVFGSLAGVVDGLVPSLESPGCVEPGMVFVVGVEPSGATGVAGLATVG